MSTAAFLSEALRTRLSAAAQGWLDRSIQEVGSGLPTTEFGARLSLASRHLPRGPLTPSAEERQQAATIDPGFNPERWSTVEAGRVALILARPDLDTEATQQAIADAFQYADEGELCALYRSLAHLPTAERFAWQAGEGCRSNMLSVFQAIVCDTSYPATHFDERSWHQAVIKCIFVETPLWRVWGLDQRLNDELARIALDLADERRSAGRPVPAELWLCLGEHGAERATQALHTEVSVDNPHRPGRVAATWALGRRKLDDRSQSLLESLTQDSDPAVQCAAQDSLRGPVPQATFSQLESLEHQARGAK